MGSLHHNDLDGRCPTCLAGVLFEYGNQLYDNYQKNPNGSFMDNGVKDINVIGLVVAAIPGGGLLRNVALEGVKNSVSYTVKEGFQVNKDVTDVALATVKGAAIGKISDKLATVGVGAGAETKLTNKEAQSAARAANRNIAKARNNPPATHT